MRLISPFHDYYDSALAYGQDESVVYERKPLEFDVKPRKGTPPKRIQELNEFISKYTKFDSGRYVSYFPDTLYSKKDVRFEVVPFTIIFCGKLYKGLEVQKHAIYAPPKHAYLYTFEEFVDFTKTNGVKITKKSPSYSKTTIAAKFKQYFTYNNSPDIDWLIISKVTIAIKKGNNIYINPRLKDYNFQKVFDSWSAYQEIDMWISGTLAWPQNFMVEIEDKYKITGHGFDPKYGFRTRPKNKRA